MDQQRHRTHSSQNEANSEMPYSALKDDDQQSVRSTSSSNQRPSFSGSFNNRYSHAHHSAERSGTSSIRRSHPFLLSSGRESRLGSTGVARMAFVGDVVIQNRKTFKQGKPIPKIAMKIINFLLGINEESSKRSITGNVFYGITIALAIGYVVSSVIYIHKDIVSDFTKTSVLDGTIALLVILIWCVIGIYAHGLAYRLFKDENFKPLLRLPSKTFFGLNSAIAHLLLMLLTIAINDYTGVWMFASQSCDKLWLTVVACKFRYVFRVAFSVFAFLWHYLVMFVIISVSRSFTISIRQLMRSLDKDGRVYERTYMGVKPNRGGGRDGMAADEDDTLLQEYAWLDQDYCEEIQNQNSTYDHHSQDSTHLPGTAAASIPIGKIPGRNPENNIVSTSAPTSVFNEPSVEIIIPPISPTTSEPTNVSFNDSTAQVRKSSVGSKEGACSKTDDVNAINQPQSIATKCNSAPSVLMSNDEILYHIWKIQTGLRVFGLATQRWMISVTALITFLLVISLVLWLKTSPKLIDLVNIALPLMFLPLLAATFAEVNFEGARLVKFIAPTEDRLSILFFLQSSPLQLTMYGFTLSYQTIATAGLGVLIALATKVFLQEISS